MGVLSSIALVFPHASESSHTATLAGNPATRLMVSNENVMFWRYGSLFNHQGIFLQRKEKTKPATALHNSVNIGS